MKNNFYYQFSRLGQIAFGLIGLLISGVSMGQVTLEKEVSITSQALYFDGNKVSINHTANSSTGYDYVYGSSLTPHGDCIKTYKHYVFMTWYKGGKNNRHVMLTRYNTQTGSKKTIEFPHQHTGYNGKWWLGETHNTIAIGISPINGTIHLAYDMHAYSNSGSFVNDYFRYSYSQPNAAEVSDSQFTLSKFVKDPIDGDYKHCTMDGKRDASHYSKFTYPKFFLNDQGELFLTMRKGTSHDGAQAFIKYDASQKKWGRFKMFNALGAGSKGETHNWSIYGSMKYVDGKMRIGFQRRLKDGTDKYKYQNGVYYAYSNDPTGASQWKNHKGQSITFPLVKAQEALVYEPGDYVQTTARNMVYIVSGFDWTVTERGDVHIISKVRDDQYKVTKYIHSYKPAGASNFTVTTNFNGADALYTSGNDVYMIGLSGGRVFVDKLEGGTNNITNVYKATSGKTFTKGIVHISDGKLYYYLKGNDTDDTHPTYLQIIDLDIQNAPPVVSMTAPANNLTVEPGTTVTLTANASDDQAVSKVNFRVNNGFYKQDKTTPYSVTWTPTTTGTYTIDAVAYDEDGQSTIASSVTVNVQSVNVTIESVTAEQSPNVATNLLDGDVSDDSRWSAQGFSKTVVFDLGSTQNITGTKMWTYLDRAYQYRIRVSNSASTGFNTVVDKTGNTSTAQPLTDNFNATGRYVKLIIEGAHNYTGDWVSINEFEVLTSGSSSARQRGSSFIEEETSAVTVFPNPSNGTFTIHLGEMVNADVLIYNMNGQKVYQQLNASQQIQLSKGSTFDTGIYLIKVIDQEGNHYDKKLMIK
ncbi:BNR-4 repeat-containing protein [Flammeovirga sp. OC4]|uniref:BNR-4 repeat-containing protein n=1 Tax=Flammeovirga sp. OC4 TaxID=1382345 RepID=UPI0006942CF7|nr:BNR-4 repeat-containing protein [Flammeovirga sp. OC4]